MSVTCENVLSLAQNNPEEVACMLNAVLQLNPACQAANKLCSDNGIKPMRRRKGQYRGAKRPPSHFNLFCSENKDHKDLKDLKFGERAKKNAEMWNKLKASKKDFDKFVKRHEVKAEVKAEVKVEEQKAVEQQKEKPARKAGGGKKKKAKAKEDSDVDVDSDSD